MRTRMNTHRPRRAETAQRLWNGNWVLTPPGAPKDEPSVTTGLFSGWREARTASRAFYCAALVAATGSPRAGVRLLSMLKAPAPPPKTINSPPPMARFLRKWAICICCCSAGTAQKLWNTSVTGTRKMSSASAPQRVLNPSTTDAAPSNSRAVAIASRISGTPLLPAYAAVPCQAASFPRPLTTKIVPSATRPTNCAHFQIASMCSSVLVRCSTAGRGARGTSAASSRSILERVFVRLHRATVRHLDPEVRPLLPSSRPSSTACRNGSRRQHGSSDPCAVVAGHSGFIALPTVPAGRQSFRPRPSNHSMPAALLWPAPVRWVAIRSAAVVPSEPMPAVNLAVFEPSEAAIEFQARGDSEFVLGSAVPHRYELAFGHLLRAHEPGCASRCRVPHCADPGAPDRPRTSASRPGMTRGLPSTAGRERG